MRFLLDQNISFKVVNLSSGTFADVKHIRQTGLVNATDQEIWQYAKDRNCTIVIFDSDFIDFTILKGSHQKSFG